MTIDARAQALAVPRPSAVRAVAAGALGGVLAVLVAAVAGFALAAVLTALGLTTTALPSLGTWLAGTGLLGGWSQTVSSSVAGGIGWSSWVGGAPMLVTLSVMLVVSQTARRLPESPWLGAGGAAAGAALAAVVLVLVSRTETVSINAAGSVDVSEGLTLLWTGGRHQGTVLGAAVLVGVTWWVNTYGLAWWRAGRAFAYGLLIIPGLVLTLVAAAAVVYLISSPALGVATVLLFPLLGMLALMGAGGAPSFVGITRLSPQPYDVWAWSAGLPVALGGLAALMVLAVVVGVVLRRRRHSGDRAAALTVPIAVAGFVCWAGQTSIVVPETLGGRTEIAVDPLAAMVIAAVMALICLLVRGDRHEPGDDERPAASPDST